MIKTSVCVRSVGQTGKTGTIREFAKTLLQDYPDYKLVFSQQADCPVPSQGDFRLVVKIKDKVIGIESKGDPGTFLKERLTELAEKFNCDIIICASRTGGETVYAVDNLKHFGFEIKVTSPYRTENINEISLLNQTKGEHILKLLQKLNCV